MTDTEQDGAEDRYSRQRIIPGWSQVHIAGATAVVVGVGALGNEAAKNLALAGLGRLILCDPNTVSVSNLSRTVLFTADDLDRPKAVAAAEALRRLVPNIEVDARVADLGAGVGLGEIADADVVLSCVDTIRARMRILGRSSLTDAALVDGGTHPYGGEIRIRLTPDEPCYGCSLSAHERGVGDLPWSCFGAGPGGHQPASIATSAMIASWMSLAALQIILGAAPSYRLLRINAVSGRTAPVSIERDPECPHHRPLPEPTLAVPVSNRDRVADLLAVLGPDEEPFTWERFSLGWRCAGCGYYPEHVRPRGGIDADTAVLSCENCGALVRARFTQRLRDAEPECRLSDLGVAPQDIVPVLASGGDYICRRLSR